ncbi:uncharacterized protein [Miscanthus floridulus]|uniref:uncharacterized protein n=1 Tax=Miscanthus floridulus TaxID=154761 RepID=UPI0034581E7C
MVVTTRVPVRVTRAGQGIGYPYIHYITNNWVAYHSITRDNYFLATSSLKVFGCLLTKLVHYPEAVFRAIDVAVTMLLLLTFLYEEVWEFLVFILSSWLMVSLLCEYTAKRYWRESRFITGLIRRILWIRRKLSRPTLSFKQLSLLSFLGRLSSSSMALLPRKKAAVPIEVKKSMVEYLVAHVVVDGDGDGDAAAPLSNGWSTLWSEKHCSSRHLSKACESKSLAEVILTSAPPCLPSPFSRTRTFLLRTPSSFFPHPHLPPPDLPHPHLPASSSPTELPPAATKPTTPPLPSPSYSLLPQAPPPSVAVSLLPRAAPQAEVLPRQPERPSPPTCSIGARSSPELLQRRPARPPPLSCSTRGGATPAAGAPSSPISFSDDRGGRIRDRGGRICRWWADPRPWWPDPCPWWLDSPLVAGSGEGASGSSNPGSGGSSNPPMSHLDRAAPAGDPSFGTGSSGVLAWRWEAAQWWRGGGRQLGGAAGGSPVVGGGRWYCLCRVPDKNHSTNNVHCLLGGLVPGAVPDDTEGAKRVYANVKEELKKVIGGCWRYHVSLEGTVYSKLVNIALAQGQEETTTMVVHKGAQLGNQLMEMAEDQVWELLANLWTELMVYLAPSSGELHVKAHKEALAQGIEYITVFWAMCTHTGVARPAVAPREEARRTCV